VWEATGKVGHEGVLSKPGGGVLGKKKSIALEKRLLLF